MDARAELKKMNKIELVGWFKCLIVPPSSKSIGLELCEFD